MNDICFRTNLIRSVQKFNLSSPLLVMQSEVEAQGETESVKYLYK